MTGPAPTRLPALLGLLLAVPLLGACGSARPTEPPSGTPQPTPTANGEASPPTSPDPIPTAAPGATPSPTFAAQPTATLSPIPLPTAPPTATPRATPQPTPAGAEIVRFRREQHGSGPRNTVDCTDPAFAGTIHLVWQVRRATGVTLAIDGPGIYDSYSGTSGSADVPFACEEPQHSYTLSTTGGTGTPASLTRVFRRGAPQVRDFAVIGPNCPDATSTVPVSVTWQIEYATGVEVWVEGALYATYSGKQSPAEGASAGTFDCSRASQLYRLRTTGGFGSPAELELQAIP